MNEDDPFKYIRRNVTLAKTPIVPGSEPQTSFYKALDGDLFTDEAAGKLPSRTGRNQKGSYAIALTISRAIGWTPSAGYYPTLRPRTTGRIIRRARVEVSSENEIESASLEAIADAWALGRVEVQFVFITSLDLIKVLTIVRFKNYFQTAHGSTVGEKVTETPKRALTAGFWPAPGYRYLGCRQSGRDWHPLPTKARPSVRKSAVN